MTRNGHSDVGLLRSQDGRVKDKLLALVKVPATMETYEFRIPYDLTVEQGSDLIARLIAAREPARYKATCEADLMFLQGQRAGEVVNPSETIRDLVLGGLLIDGSMLALV